MQRVGAWQQEGLSGELRLSAFLCLVPVGHQLVEVGHLIKQDPGTSYFRAAAKCAAFAQDDNFVVSCEL
jgi:hypothetical protein